MRRALVAEFRFFQAGGRNASGGLPSVDQTRTITVPVTITMKVPILTAALVALAFASCQKPTAEIQRTDDVSATPVPAPVSTPAPPAVIATAPPTAPPSPELAPPGIFYLLAAVRVETDSGVTGLPPGTGVKFVREGIYLSSAGEVALRPDQITNNLATARQARDAERLKQVALRTEGASQVAQAPAAAATTGVENAAQHQQALAEIDRQHSEARRTALAGEEQRLNAQLRVLQARLSKESYDHLIKGRTVTSTTPSEIKMVETALQAVREQMRALPKLR